MKLHKLGICLLALTMIFAFAVGCEPAPEGEVYQGEAEGFGGTVVVEIAVDEGEMVDINVVEDPETPGYGDEAFDALIPEILDAQSTDGIDVHSGATVSSEALFEAVEEAMAQAGL
ncbi:MAG: FMN-binding protein [Candidatus Syntrophonatronum acetioxidans]|uniref:FMN-binding protein n=1 Tax=Candidatus Syntrophonatronum acetioxidans TaxID=1795816 RepID=A0A424YBQ9_9FIRM|nr:MAG: FMN-binding protein [Candidatus Syntrophonatronum acetioxidans]